MSMASERSMTMVSERSPVLLTISCCRLGAVCGSCIWVEKSSMSGSNLARSYLVLYNTWQSLGWGMALCQCVLSVWLPEGYQKVYEHSGTFVSRCGLQTITTGCNDGLTQLCVLRVFPAVVSSGNCTRGNRYNHSVIPGNCMPLGS